MKNDPSQIADHLIEEHGVEGALERVREGIELAHDIGDNYRLSVWREIRRDLHATQNSDTDQEGV
jgi:hypothetical protein